MRAHRRQKNLNRWKHVIATFSHDPTNPHVSSEATWRRKRRYAQKRGCLFDDIPGSLFLWLCLPYYPSVRKYLPL